MDPQSPPKRMTRARAAKTTTTATEPTAKTTRIVTAAAKAKAITATRGTASTSAKRKTRPDDADDVDSSDNITQTSQVPVKQAPAPAPAMKAIKATRGRPKKVVVDLASQAPAAATATIPTTAPELQQPVAEPIKPTRGRPKKVVEPAAPEPSKTIRATRAKKTNAEEETAGAAGPAKKATRGRPPTGAAPKQPLRSAMKKTVKFEEPEKENIAPSRPATAASRAPKASASAPAPEPVSGLRARPMRRPATAGRALRGTKSTATTTTTTTATTAKVKASAAGDKEDKPLPLSPKKVNQMATNKSPADSDDELGEKTPVRQLMRNPIKPAGGHKKADHAAPAENNDEDDLNPSEAASTLILGTPAKRPAASPWKNTIKSPAKRVEGVLGMSVTQTRTDGQPAQPPMKMSLLQSPAKRPPPGTRAPDLGLGGANGFQPGATPMKMSLFSSPAKRALSPAKGLFAPVQEEVQPDRSPAPKATILATPLPGEVTSGLRAQDGTEDEEMSQDDGEAVPDSPTRLRFPGRLSAVLPRHADPELNNAVLVLPEAGEEDRGQEVDPADVQDDEDEDDDEVETLGEPMALDEPVVEDEHDNSTSTTLPTSPPKHLQAMFGLREKDLHPFTGADFDSEDEQSPQKGRLVGVFGAAPATPSPATSSATPRTRNTAGRTRSSGRSATKRVRVDDRIGFTPLADQLSSWTAGPSPLKTGISPDSPTPSPLGRMSAAPEPAPMQTTFFEDEMLVRPGTAETEVESSPEAEMADAPADGMEENSESPVLEDIPFTEEDVALAAEANEMSLMEPDQVEELVHNSSLDDSVSEASQEYGDENDIPIDPTLMPADGAEEIGVPLVTPQRHVRREFHTVSKVPLKPAAEDSPQSKMKKRSHSISRLPVQRPTQGTIRSASVISYSPMKQQDEPEPEENDEDQESTPVTPQKSEVTWSTMGTPARTPRRDMDPALLRGAVVFVDVYTTEGADASGIFIELLGQMGARCVKSWPWNPTSPNSTPAKDGAAAKVGITHVVYKDGGKRTLEKVRQSGGVVQCVGVSWVLDCERENQWLDEAPYYIDTSVVPRGGARRRKSMEPKSIANMNGMLVPTPVRSVSSGGPNSRGSQGTPNTPVNRRDSALWMRTPDDESDRDHHSHEDDDDQDNENSFIHDDNHTEWNMVLTPVPKTPAPEAIARFAANIELTTPSEGSVDGEDPLMSPATMMTRTCPPKQQQHTTTTTVNAFSQLGAGILGRDKDESVLMRLMAARRKSLQFAPKVGSPLSRAWKH
ncbi:hypothetical protein B0T22DRAFT_397481 [Podospora appendiculata]|uniref:BRCT domain-containing protein n=1 Tax=Podospora appendiculata TaxID=314037 RepID=A0AAE0XJJ7_9PEZI|nr:hypothetical protein B0T22DRAFT_397481 [Podospora appendiculata]